MLQLLPQIFGLVSQSPQFLRQFLLILFGFFQFASIEFKLALIVLFALQFVHQLLAVVELVFFFLHLVGLQFSLDLAQNSFYFLFLLRDPAHMDHSFIMLPLVFPEASGILEQRIELEVIHAHDVVDSALLHNVVRIAVGDAQTFKIVLHFLTLKDVPLNPELLPYLRSPRASYADQLGLSRFAIAQIGLNCDCLGSVV